MGKGQVTMFIILGMILVIIISLSFILRNEISDAVARSEAFRPVKLQQESRQLESFVAKCIKPIAEEALLKIASQGGYYETAFMGYDTYRVPLYYTPEKESVPAMPVIESAVSDYLSSEAEKCALGFSQFGFDVRQLKKPLAEVSIGKKIVSVEVNWPLEIASNGETEKITSFSTEFESGFDSAYTSAIELYESQKEKSLISLAELARLSTQKDYVLYFDFVQDYVLYIITFDNLMIQDKPIVYTFAIKPKQSEQFVSDGVDFTEIFSFGEASVENTIADEEEL